MRKNPPFGLILGVPADVNTKYVYGSGVGALNTSVRRYQKKRASFTCCSENVTTTPLVPTTYTLSYNSNGGTGILPAGTTEYSGGTSVTILGNSGSPPLSRSGYLFAGWNTAADGTGTKYVGGDPFTINANTILYANWIIGGVTLRYNAGTGGTGTAPSSSGTSYTAFSTVNVVDNTGSFTNGSLQFGGWNTAADGSGTSYPPNSQYTMPGANPFPPPSPAGVYLYAQWINPAITYTLTYDAGTNGSGSPPALPTTYSSNSTVNILQNTGYSNSDTTKVFYGWNTVADGSGTSYPVGSNITMNANKNLYAQWGSPPLLTVTYDANGATGGAVPAAPSQYPTNVQVPILGQGSLTRPGYAFLGWNSDPNGAGSVYAPGYTFTSKTATLYAQWAPGSTVRNCGGGTGNNQYIYYNYPFAQIVASTNTITIYTTCIVGSTSSNVGSGAAPEGLISITSKMVITSATITINTNTTYASIAPYNYAPYNYSYNITNGSGVTYWPSGATISTVTFPFTPPLPVNSPASYPGTPTYSISTRGCVNGCGLSGSGSASPPNFVTFNFFNQGVTLNYSNGTNTIFVSSPNNSLYTTNNGSTWTQTPNSLYPYSLITPRSSAALTTVTIIPSTASEYIYPSMPNYTVEYNGNGATSGSIPTPQYFAPYGTATFPYTVVGNTGSLIKSTAPSTFSRWNTQANGLGTDYGPGYITTYAGGASITLYAIWV